MTRRFAVVWRCLFAMGALALLVLAVMSIVRAATTMTSGSPVLVVAALVELWAVRICIGCATARVVATPDGVEIRNPVGRRYLRWADVESVEPTHNGLKLRLHDGTAVVAGATARGGLRFLRPRVDHEALSYFRDHILEG